jgi:hypothetical protein
MNKLLLASVVAAVALFLGVQNASAQKAFEGSVTWKMVSAQMGDQNPHEMTMNIKGEKFEIDMDAGPQGLVHMFVDRPNKKMTMVMDARKMGMVQNLPDDASPEAAQKAKDVDVKATGQKSTINGHAAELYVLTSPNETVNMWMSKDFGPDLAGGLRAAMANNTRGSQAQKKVFRELAEKGYFPVKIEGKDGGSLELVSVEPKSLPDSKFEVPADVMIMPAAMGGMGRPGAAGQMPQGQMPQGQGPHGQVPSGAVPHGREH